MIIVKHESPAKCFKRFLLRSLDFSETIESVLLSLYADDILLYITHWINESYKSSTGITLEMKWGQSMSVSKLKYP